jgi:hypothetical protein
MNLGDRQVVRTYHPDGHTWCWEVREVVEAEGYYSKPGDLCWVCLTREPFNSEEKAKDYLESITVFI